LIVRAHFLGAFFLEVFWPLAGVLLTEARFRGVVFFAFLAINRSPAGAANLVKDWRNGEFNLSQSFPH
jgi:hypothetical protein